MAACTTARMWRVSGTGVASSVVKCVRSRGALARVASRSLSGQAGPSSSVGAAHGSHGRLCMRGCTCSGCRSAGSLPAGVGAVRTVCTTRAAWADYGPGKRPAAKPIQGQGRGVRPLEVSIDDVELGTDLEWDVGTITTDVDTETDHGDHTRDFMGLHQHVELFDSQDELMQDVLLFRDHITSAPRIRLPATLVSKAPEDNQELMDVAHLLDQNTSLTYQARERIYEGIADFMEDKYDDPETFPPEGNNGRWMHLVNTDIEYRYQIESMHPDTESEAEEGGDGDASTGDEADSAAESDGAVSNEESGDAK